jgi:branched-chain amino acid transport system ATP-binding protein
VSRLLEISGLEVAYGRSQALFGVDLAMEEGEAATLLGRNGMGKTTLLRAICGLQPLRSGSIRFAGERIDGWRADRIGRAGIALVPEAGQSIGRGAGIRTRDPLHPMQVRYQAAPRPDNSGPLAQL